MSVGWFPRYSPDGSRLTWERPGYWQAQWFNLTTEIAHNGAVLVIGGLPTSFSAPIELSAGGNFWAGYRGDPHRVYTSDGQTIFGAGVPVVNPLGQWGYVDDRQAEFKNLIWQGAVIARGAIAAARASRTALVWNHGGRTWGHRFDQTVALDIQAAPWEAFPVPIDTPSGPWVLSQTQTGIVLRPFGSSDGYRLDNNGQAFGPDAVYRDGGIVAVFTNDRGEQTEYPFDLNQPRVPLWTAPAPPQPPTPPPVPPVPPVPPQPPRPPQPPNPGPVPVPPKPSIFQPAKGVVMSEPKRVALRLGQMFASVDPAEVNKGPFPGWYPVRFLKATKPSDPHAAFTLAQPRAGDLRLLVRPESVPDAALSIDATEFSGDIGSEFGVKPHVSEADWGGYEALNGWTLQGQGIDIVLVQYDRDGQKYASACLTVVEL